MTDAEIRHARTTTNQLRANHHDADRVLINELCQTVPAAVIAACARLEQEEGTR